MAGRSLHNGALSPTLLAQSCAYMVRKQGGREVEDRAQVNGRNMLILGPFLLKFQLRLSGINKSYTN